MKIAISKSDWEKQEWAKKSDPNVRPFQVFKVARWDESLNFEVSRKARDEEWQGEHPNNVLLFHGTKNSSLLGEFDLFPFDLDRL